MSQVFRLFNKQVNSNTLRYLSTQSEPLYMQYTPVHRMMEKKQNPNDKPIIPKQNENQKNQKSKLTVAKNDLPTHQVRSAASTYLVVDDA